MFHYFVSYTFSDSTGNGIAFGYAEVTIGKPLTTIEAINEVGKKLTEKLPDLSNIVILNFQLLRKESDAQ